MQVHPKCIRPSQRISEGLVCPDCNAALGETSSTVACRRCGQVWPVIDGIPNFVSEFPYWGEIPQPQMHTINRLTEDQNWKAVLRESKDDSVQRAAVMIQNLERANWHSLANVSPEGRVLDLGAGTGTTSHALAKVYAGVVALEPVLERVQFMRNRFVQEGLANVQIIRSSLWTLPFPAESFDLIAMNGVLEWVAQGLSGNPREHQIRALKNARRLLRPEGCLYVGIENRLGYGYFLGCDDPHAGLPYVTILPRPVARWYARKRGHDSYYNYLYSAAGYRRLLRESGFGKVEIYLAIPSYNEPRFFIPLNGRGFSYYWRSFNLAPARGLRGLLRALPGVPELLKYFEYSFAIFAH